MSGEHCYLVEYQKPAVEDYKDLDQRDRGIYPWMCGDQVDSGDQAQHEGFDLSEKALHLCA